jgi:hypothetical protein
MVGMLQSQTIMTYQTVMASEVEPPFVSPFVSLFVSPFVSPFVSVRVPQVPRRQETPLRLSAPPGWLCRP